MKRQWWVGVLVWALVLGPVWAHSEGWGPVGPPPWTNEVVQTVGGISYFTHTSWPLAACHRVSPGLLSRNGNTLTQIINEEAWSGICYECFDCYHPETHVSVLGALAPGDYLFRALSSVEFGGTFPFAEIAFSVPATSTPTLAAGIDPGGTNFTISVAGVSNVDYIIQRTSTLTNWSSVVSNKGPFTWSEAISAEPTNRFYRVLIRGN